MNKRYIGLFLGVAFSVPAGALADLPPLMIESVGRVDLPAGGAAAGQLSGLSFAGDDSWLAVSDASGELFALEIQINPSSGAISAASVGLAVSLEGASDVEGVAYDPSTDTAWVSDETGPAVRRHSLTTGAALQSLTLPEIFDQIRPNYSLESLTRDPMTGGLWTANEEALVGDGDVSASAAGTVVRLQRFDSTGAATGQWAYGTDSIRVTSTLVDLERSGVVDLAALPDGRLLVLEREASATLPVFRHRIYLADFVGATDISSLTALQGESYVPVEKGDPLWEFTTSSDNFEGMALGPPLLDGGYSLLLISDDGSVPLLTLNQSLYALKIEGVVPEPAAVALLGLPLLALRRRRARFSTTR